MINNFIILIFLSNFIIVQSINLLIYSKIINWYENIQNKKWNQIYFNSNIDTNSANNFINLIDKQVLNKNDDIYIILDTNGGDLYQTYKIISYMDLLRNNLNIKFHCICMKAFSSGFFIYQLCDYRYWIDSNSIIMIHEPQLNIEGTFDFILNYLESNFMIDYKNYKIILERIYSKTTINENILINKIKNNDWIISSYSEIEFFNFSDYLITIT